MSYKQISENELKKILLEHKLWLAGDKNGKRADLSYVDLRYVSLRRVDLRKANLSHAYMNEVDMRTSDLSEAILDFAILKEANLSDANLMKASLKGTNLSCANLLRADLHEANLLHADLRCTNMSYCDLRKVRLSSNMCGANLYCAELDDIEKIRQGVCLNRRMIGYKACRGGIIVKLEIPANAVVFSINNSQLRTNVAKVISIEDRRGRRLKSAMSIFDSKFVYKVGKVVVAKSFNSEYNVEYGAGIHFFKTKKEAEDYE